MHLRKPLTFAIVITIATLLVHCHSQYRPLQTADRCACKPTEFCTVTPSANGGEPTLACAPLPQVCGTRPTCDCVGGATDACRDEDGRLTVMPQRPVTTCDACSKDEYCMDESSEQSARFCRVLPPQCDETPTCACFMETRGHSGRFACNDDHGRIVARLATR